MQLEIVKIDGLAIKGKDFLIGRYRIDRIPLLVFDRLGNSRLAILKPRAAPQKPLEAREKNRQFKRLWQIIIGARRESLQDVFGTAARGQHENWDVVLCFPQG